MPDTSRMDKINAIVALRKPIANETAEKIEQLKSIQANLQVCLDLLSKALQKGMTGEQRSAATERQADIKKILDDLLPGRIRDLAQLERRFSRPTLNIGIVGNAGQGKSTLLQQLTGLSDDEIPTGAKGDCTGAAAIIENTKVPEVYADIEFYSEAEFLSHIVAPYFRMLSLPPPLSLAEFARPLPEEVKGGHYDEVKFVERLQSGLENYRRYLGESSRRIGRGEIRAYTAKSDKDGTPLSVWAAVKSAKVCCAFAGLEGERISVGDTPGLGDRTVLEAEEKLMNDFGRSIDAVVMLRKVKERGIRKEDVRLFNLVKAAIPELPPEKWSYFMVNVFASDRTVPATAEALKFLPEDFKNSSLKDMQGYVELDCSDRDAVLTAFDKMLDSIAANQQALDKTLYSKRLAETQKLFGAIGDVLPKLFALFPVSGGDEKGFLEATARFKKEIWKYLVNKLAKLVKKYKSVKDNDNEEFKENLQNIAGILKAHTPGLPSEQDMELHPTLQIGHAEESQKIRRLILTELDAMDKGLMELFDKLRVEAKKCLMDDDGGKMGKIVFNHDGADVSWWDALSNDIALRGQIETQKSTAQKIGISLRKFDEATLSFRNFLLPRILSCFNVLDTESEENKKYGYHSGDTVGEVIACIDMAAQNGIDKACAEIGSFAKEPSMALFACIDDMYDAFVKTDGQNDACDLWAEFYADHRHEVWPEVFKNKEADAKFRHDWNDAVMALKTATGRANA